MNKAQILFVGDFDKGFLKQMANEDWEIKHKINTEQAIDLLSREKITAIIARDKIDQLNGYELCLLLKSQPGASNFLFYILGDKKQRGKNFPCSLFAQPDRIAEFSEVLKKPQSLVKLLKEELKELSKNKILHSRQHQALSACTAAEITGGLTDKVISELLLERWVSSNILKLLRRPKSKAQYLSECFSVFHTVLNCDLFGIAIAGADKPWFAFSGQKNINQESFGKLTGQVANSFVLTQPMSLLMGPPIAEKGGANISDSLILSVLNEGPASGVLVVAKYDGQQFTPLERAIVNYIQLYAMPLFEFLIEEQRMEELLGREAVRAAVDSLTGLYNLEFLIGFLQQQLLFSFRNKLPVSLLMIDVDGFSQINNVLGPAISDTILIKLAERLLSIIRGSDLLARYSGDKFVIVLPNTPLKGARVLAEKIRLEIEQTNFFAGRQPGPSITISVGLAEYDPHDLNPETILKEAKMALQNAKENGRNKVASSSR